MKILSGILFAGIVVWGLVCAPACTEDKAVLVLGDSVTTLGNTFADTAAAMDKAVDAGKITKDQYRTWVVFGKKFQAAYPLAVHLMEQVMIHKDETLQAQVTAILAQLGGELADFAVLVGVQP